MLRAFVLIASTGWLLTSDENAKKIAKKIVKKLRGIDGVDEAFMISKFEIDPSILEPYLENERMLVELLIGNLALPKYNVIAKVNAESIDKFNEIIYCIKKIRETKAVNIIFCKGSELFYEQSIVFLRCTKCGSEMPRQAIYCGICGAKLKNPNNYSH